MTSAQFARNMIKYVKGDLFNANSGVLAHACNCYGVWGGGIAVAFRKKFPAAYEAYHQHCALRSPQQLLGTCYLIPDGKFKIACLFTSDNSSVDETVAYTKSAMEDLIRQAPDEPISMPKINAGIFAVPWEKTESALVQLDYPINVYVL